MAIAKNQPWGTPGRLALDAPVVHSDGELRSLVASATRTVSGTREVAPLEVGLLGGDLCRTVGGRGDRDRLYTDAAVRLPIDVGVAVLDGVEHLFVAHLVVRRSWWWGRVVAVMNAQWIGAWDVAPRSHPNDGLLDVFDADMSLDDRWKARSRLITGTHVPHPSIAERRVGHLGLELERAAPVWLDGEKVGSARRLAISLIPDAFTCVV